MLWWIGVVLANSTGGPIDTGASDTGVYDTGAASIDTGTWDSAVVDSGRVDTGVIDTGTVPLPPLDFPSPVAYWPLDALTLMDRAHPDLVGGRMGDLGETDAVVGVAAEGRALDGLSDRIDLGDVLDEVFAGPQAFTVGLWIAPEASDAARVVVGKRADASCDPAQDERQWSLSLLPSGQLQAVFSTPDGSSRLVAESRFPVPMDEWSHVMLRYDGAGANASSRVSLVVDGVPRHISLRRDGVAFDLQDSTAHLTVGGRTDADGEGCAEGDDVSYAGAVDELALWSTSLSDAEAAAVYARSAAGGGLLADDVVLGRDITLVIDSSCSMGGDGEAGTGAAIETFGRLVVLDPLPLDRIAAVEFSNDSSVWRPLTFVGGAEASILDTYTEASWTSFCCSGATNPGAGLGVMLSVLEAAPLATSRQVIILISDGNPNPSNLESLLVSESRRAGDAGVDVYAIAFGAGINSTIMHTATKGSGREASPAAWSSRYLVPNATGVEAILSSILDEL